MVLIICLIIVVVSFLIYRLYQASILEDIYETEAKPIDTTDFTFEQAVGGCGYAAAKIIELDKDFHYGENEIKAMYERNMGQLGELFGTLFSIGAYKANKNYPEPPKNKSYRIFHQRCIQIISFSSIIVLLSVITPIAHTVVPAVNLPLGFILPMLTCCLTLLWILRLYMALPADIRREQRLYPWRFNIRPIGSALYLAQETFNNCQEHTHDLYYRVYLPCKRKADTLIHSADRNSELYISYREIANANDYLQSCTPRERIKKNKRDIRNNQFKMVGKIVGIGTGVMLVATGAFIGMVNNAASDFGSSPTTKKGYMDDDGNLYDEDGNRVPFL
jgi:hypothetical protein